MPKKIHPDDARGPVAKFARNSPGQTLFIKKQQWNSRFSIAWRDASGNYHDLTTYARDRDCVRRLLELGYKREGQAWRLLPLSVMAA